MAQEVLDIDKGKNLSFLFYSLLHSNVITADIKIFKLNQDLKHILQVLSQNPNACSKYHANDPCQKSEGNAIENCCNIEDLPTEMFMLVIELVTSCISDLRECSSKLEALNILLKLSQVASVNIIMERILPLLFQLLRDKFSRVRIRSVCTLTEILSTFTCIPCNNAVLFSEYIFNGLTSLTSDKCFLVRAAYAENISKLAKVCLVFLEHCLTCDIHASFERPSEYELHLCNIQELVQKTVVELLIDPNNLVKRSLLKNGITELCVCFGKQKTSDIILAHMITFLNFMDDKELRCSFFDNIIGIALYVGNSCSPLLIPLCLASLTDPEEFIVASAINATAALVEAEIVHKRGVLSILEEVSCLLVHPNLWIRHAISGLVLSCYKLFNYVDHVCRLDPLLKPYVKKNVSNSNFIFWDNLVPPFPRRAYTFLTNYVGTIALFHALEYQKANQKWKISPSDLRSSMKVLRNLELTREEEQLILHLKSYLLRVIFQRNKFKVESDFLKSLEGNVLLTELDSPKTYVFPPYNSQMKFVQHEHEISLSNGMTSEYYSDSPTEILSVESSSSLSQHKRKDATNKENKIMSHSHDYKNTAIANVEQLLARKVKQFEMACRNVNFVSDSNILSLPSGWAMQSSLVAHLQEHRDAVMRLTPIPYSSMFASSSADGCIKIWDCCKMEGRSIVNRSLNTINLQSGPVVGATPCYKDSTLFAATVNGRIVTLNFEASRSDYRVVCSKKINTGNKGCIVDVHSCCSQNNLQSILIYANLFGSVGGWDPRVLKHAWDLKVDLCHGALTSFCIDLSCNWIAVGTTLGKIICFDLRFHLMVSLINHPLGCPIRKLIPHPTMPSWIIIATGDQNGVSVWNLETQQCELEIVMDQPDCCYVKAMYSNSVDSLPFIVTGGSDKRVTFWDLVNPSKSKVLVPPWNGSHEEFIVQDRHFDGRTVLQETKNKILATASEIKSLKYKRGPEALFVDHTSWITDITLCKASQILMVTGDMDGIIKLWK